MAPKSKPKQALEHVSPINLKNNIAVLTFFRTFVSVITGIVIGILGVEGWWGFLPHLAAQILCAGAMLLKGATNPSKFFFSWSNLLFANVFASTTFLTYILFWMIFYNLGHVF